MKHAMFWLTACLAAGDLAAAVHLWWVVDHKAPPGFVKAEAPGGDPAMAGVRVHGHADGTGVTTHP